MHTYTLFLIPKPCSLTCSQEQALASVSFYHPFIDLRIIYHRAVLFSRSVVSDSFDPMDYSPPGSSVHEDSPGKNTGVRCRALLQGILPTQGSNPGLLHYRQILYHLRHQGSPRILVWVTSPFSRGSSWLRNRTEVSCITGRFFNSWATREAHLRTI